MMAPITSKAPSSNVVLFAESTGLNAHTSTDAPTETKKIGTKKDRKSTRLNSSHANISYAVFCLKKTTTYLVCFFFNDTATTEIYTLSLHDALPICLEPERCVASGKLADDGSHNQQSAQQQRCSLCGIEGIKCPHIYRRANRDKKDRHKERSEEHTSELQSRQYLVCRLLLEKNNDILSMFFF